MVVIAAGDAYGPIDLQRNVPMCSSGSDSRVAYRTSRPTSKFAKFNIGGIMVVAGTGTGTGTCICVDRFGE